MVGRSRYRLAFLWSKITEKTFFHVYELLPAFHLLTVTPNGVMTPYGFQSRTGATPYYRKSVS